MRDFFEEKSAMKSVNVVVLSGFAVLLLTATAVLPNGDEGQPTYRSPKERAPVPSKQPQEAAQDRAGTSDYRRATGATTDRGTTATTATGDYVDPRVRGPKASNSGSRE